MKTFFACIIVLATFCEQAASQIQVTFNGDTTKVWDKNIEWLCAANFVVGVNITQDSVFITELDTGRLATCTCYYTLCSSIVGLNAGTYHALISRQYRIPYQSRDTTISTGVITFTVLNASSRMIATSLYQSACTQTPVSVSNGVHNAVSSAMLSNYPNPFNPVTIIRYSLPITGHVTLSVFDLTGRRISTLVDETKRSGTYEVNYDASGLASGTYICRLNTVDQVLSTKITVVK